VLKPERRFLVEPGRKIRILPTYFRGSLSTLCIGPTLLCFVTLRGGMARCWILHSAR
jgi:hypothetical protein